MTSERLKQLLIKCMDWIEGDHCDRDESYDTFEYLGFNPEELEEFGFGYLIKNEEEE